MLCLAELATVLKLDYCITEPHLQRVAIGVIWDCFFYKLQLLLLKASYVYYSRGPEILQHIATDKYQFIDTKENVC